MQSFVVINKARVLTKF